MLSYASNSQDRITNITTKINIKTNETISVTTSTLKNVKINTKEYIILER